MRATPEEMAYREYLARCLEDEALTQKYERTTNSPRPPYVGHDDNRADAGKWAAAYREWLVGYRRWLTTRYGWDRAPAWLLEETTR